MKKLTEYDEFKNFLNSLKEQGKRPKLLLHSCCGPCSAYVLTFLNEYFDITIYYYNPNIYPENEFLQRLKTQQELLAKLDFKVSLLFDAASYDEYLKAVKNYENSPEKTYKCYLCYKFRMEKLKEVAVNNHFDFFTTTLSVSPHKNSKWINEIGKALSSSECKFLYSDFKKENGYLQSTILAKNYALYRQDYCGCKVSFEESLKRNVKKTQN